MSRRDGFTLVEMMVVAAILAVLIALLLPTMEKARQLAVRADCQSGRRQNVMSITLYTSDHNGYLPYTDRDNVDWDAMMLGGSTRHDLPQKVYAMGSVAKGGYIDHPSLLFCPAFVRGQKAFRPGTGVANMFYDQPDKMARWKRNKDVPWPWRSIFAANAISLDRWEKILSGKVANAYSGLAAHSQGWIKNRKQNHQSWGSQRVWQELTLADIAKHHDDQDVSPYGGISPALISCADDGNGFSRNHWHTSNRAQGKSHERRGVNVGFFDGSTRWISAEEHGHNYAAHRIYVAHMPFLKWARKHLRVTP